MNDKDNRDTAGMYADGIGIEGKRRDGFVLFTQFSPSRVKQNKNKTLQVKG